MTSVKDAYDCIFAFNLVWEKIRTKINKDVSELQVIQEFEDKDGNVINEKTYNDMRRQGLI